ncbi:hypothetical protein BD311DRAFT_758724 [Dichomitus squalens]|uniref:Uncharacterized protein n=1 Tax=Dichomitus squalens TaxID=114155 RepID=A0A4Q9ML49_9APHY|nr:hypothetical protein BD311DRAFT_758724 [Dichomitus squalens]
MIHRRQAHRLVSLSPSPPSTASQRVHKNRAGLMPPCADLTTARALYGHSSIFLLLFFPIGTRTSVRFGNSTHALPVRLPGAIYMVNQSPWCNSRHLSMPVMLSRWTSRRSQHLQGLESA